MSEPESDREPSRRPAPPSPPPQPPPELLRQIVPHVPLTPMMDFFQRRLEALERELEQERERAKSAQNLLAHQEDLRREVDASLKAMHEQLRREKGERESEEEKSHSRGRIDALEKRLDEMHQAWVSILKDALAQGDGTARQAVAGQAALVRDLAAVADDLRALKEQIGTTLRDRLSAFAAEVQEKLSQQERRQTLEIEKQELRMAELGRERAALQKEWEEKNHDLRQELAKERIARENALDERLAEVCRNIEAMGCGQAQAAGAVQDLKAELSQVMARLNTPPQAKDQIITDLEREKADLIKSLKDRSDSLGQYVAQRREIEKTMGASMMELHSRLDAEREKNRQQQGRIAELQVEIKAAQDRVQAAQQTAQEKEKLAATRAAERDALARSLAAEAEKFQQQTQARNQAQENWTRHIQEAQKRLEAELARNVELSATVAELRAQISTLGDHLAKSLQEKDAVTGRFAAWSQDREKLLQTIREKDEIISMLSSTFQGMLNKEGSGAQPETPAKL